MNTNYQDRMLEIVQRLSDIGIALSEEDDEDAILEQILLFAKDLTKADGGTIYSLRDDEHLVFRILHETVSVYAKAASSPSRLTYPVSRWQ